VLYLHVIAGGIAILAGFAAMSFAKGSMRHRRAGDVYGAAMIVMTSSAFISAAFLRPHALNALAAMVTFYLVATAWLAARRNVAHAGLPEYAASLVGAAAAVYGFTVVSRVEEPGMEGFGFAFGGIAALCVISDVRYLIRRAMSRRQQLVRHVWRMTFTWFVATGSFFLGQMKHLPAWVTAHKLNVLIALTPVALLVFWLIRIRFPPWSRKSRPAVIIAATET
jgi:hypothetical protein